MKRLLLYTAIQICGFMAFAQDPHFSQYFASPITQNPANNGAFNGTLRVASNYRSQWWGVGAPFTTATASIEGFLFTKKMNRPENKLAFSVLGLSDASSAGALKTNYLAAGLAYHMALDAFGEHNLGLGFTASYAQKYLDFNKLTFANQFASGGFNTAIPSGEFVTGNYNYYNFNVGALYTKVTEASKFYVGVAAFNFLDEQLKYTNNGFYQNVDMRYSINTGFTKVTDNSNAYSLSAYASKQNGANEIMLGGAYSWLLQSSDAYKVNYLSAGAWYRVDDALIPYLGLSWGDMQLGFSYDIITSAAKLKTPKNGSFELSLIFTNHKSESGLKCPGY